jgi:hypothetical protein
MRDKKIKLINLESTDKNLGLGYENDIQSRDDCLFFGGWRMRANP